MVVVYYAYPPIMVQFAKAALGPPVYMAKLNSTGIPRYLKVSRSDFESQRRLMDARHTRHKVHGDIRGSPVLKESQMAKEFCKNSFKSASCPYLH